MNWIQLELILIAIAASVACALPGVFLMLRGVVLISDAMSHAVLLGIISLFLLIRKLYSPFLLIGASLAGLLTVLCTEMLVQSKCLKKDAAIGLVFPLFFSLGVILVTLYARDIHIDTDMVLVGELALTPFYRLIIEGKDYGPSALWQLGIVILVNGIGIALFFKELIVATFDQEYATIMGFYPSLLHYMLMVITSFTVVSAFDVVGAIVVVALMVMPAATAYLLTARLLPLIGLALGTSVSAAVGGYCFAWCADVSIAGSIAMIAGMQFAAVFALSMVDRYRIRN